MKLIITSGYFNPLHSGHVSYLEEAKKLGIPLLPQLVIFGDETYRDDTEMGPAAFLEKLASTSVRPKTAAPEPVRYQPIFEKWLGEKSTILVICPSAYYRYRAISCRLGNPCY